MQQHVQIVKVNVDEAQALAAGFEVQGIPHSRLIIGNALSEPVVGYVPYEQLKDMLQAQIDLNE